MRNRRMDLAGRFYAESGYKQSGADGKKSRGLPQNAMSGGAACRGVFSIIAEFNDAKINRLPRGGAGIIRYGLM